MANWLKFTALGIIWGSSFLLIKIAVEEMGALPLVSIRIGGAALLFALYLVITKRKLPAPRSERLAILFTGIFNTALPFFLISWGETHIDSGLASVLNATVPLFTLIFAHFSLADDRITTQKFVGVLLGFVGVAVITIQNLSHAGGALIWQFVVLSAMASYGISVIVVRKYLRQVSAFTVAGYSTIVGGIAVVVATLLLVHPLPADLSTKALLAAITLAILNTFVAYFLWYGLIAAWGARASLVTYMMPVVGVTLGVIVLDEPLGWELLIGGTLIIGGIILAKARPIAMRRLFGKTAEPAPIP